MSTSTLSTSQLQESDFPNNIQLAEGQDADVIIPKLRALLEQWHLCLDGRGLQRSFKFKTFKTTWEFMSCVAERMKSVRHHAEWWNCYNQTLIQWTTHRPYGLTIKDVEMAAFCDEKARELGEVEGEGKGKRERRVLFGVAEVEV